MACGLFVYAGATDMADGYIARNFKNQASSLGSFLDPLSDKILVGKTAIAIISIMQIVIVCRYIQEVCIWL